MPGKSRTLFKALFTLFLFLPLLSPSGSAQWDPNNGDWGKTDTRDLRVMTYNVYDTLCSSNSKQEGLNDWHALVCIVAGLQPDILILQETGDNTGNGTGSGVDSVANLVTTIDLFLHGGTDSFNGNVAVTSYVQNYAAAYDLPHVFVSAINDYYNRNVVLSRYPFKDLNGDTKSMYSDLPYCYGDAYAPGGVGGIRGYMLAEINLPNLKYAGDVVVGNAHLKSGGSSSDKLQRLEAAQNLAYIVDYWYNGAGTGIPDPNGKVYDNPQATQILDPNTPVILGGDWNENEATNGRDGPALWTVRAQYYEGSGNDGTDRDLSDATYDAATHPISGSSYTLGNTKLDYLAWQDSIAQIRRSFIFDSVGLSISQLPPEVLNYHHSFPYLVSNYASDHLPVIADFILPETAQPLQSYVSKLKASTGGEVLFDLNEPSRANQSYFMLGSLTGTVPGLTFPGNIHLPLNWDFFTDLVIAMANGPAMVRFSNSLDASGTSWAMLDTQGALPPSAVGAVMYFAYVVYNPYVNYASNAASVEIVP